MSDPETHKLESKEQTPCLPSGGMVWDILSHHPARQPCLAPCGALLEAPETASATQRREVMNQQGQLPNGSWPCSMRVFPLSSIRRSAEALTGNRPQKGAGQGCPDSSRGRKPHAMNPGQRFCAEGTRRADATGRHFSAYSFAAWAKEYGVCRDATRRSWV